jgi:isopenicillin-N epimerase
VSGEPPVWPGDHDAVRALWTLDPDVAFVNHGAYGATPRPVLAAQDRWRALLEADPVDFLHRRYAEHVAPARAAVAAFLGADPDGLAFVPNATTGVATVVRSLGIGPGDRVVVTDHTYPAVVTGLRALGAEVVVVPLEVTAPDLAAPVLAAVDERTRLVVVDAVTSVTALVLPVAAIVAGCRSRGVPCVVDAAHAPGLLPVDLAALDPDYWVANLHKWCCAPKGTGVLWVRPGLRSSVRPLVLSHGYGLGFAAEFDWAGTHDPTGWLAAPDALALLGSLGWPALRSYGGALAAWGGALVASAARVTLPVPPERHAAMVLLDCGLPAYDAAEALRNRLWHADRVEVNAVAWRGRGYLRLSAWAYNRPVDYERLAAGLAREVGGA